MPISLPYKFQNLDVSQLDDAVDDSGDVIGKAFPVNYLDANFTALAQAITDQIGKTMVVGSTEPANPEPGLWWYDTGSNLLKLRNTNNTSWQDVWNLASNKPVIANLSNEITAAMIHSSLKSPDPSVEGLRRLGRGANDAMPGNTSIVPPDGSITTAKLADGSVTQSKLKTSTGSVSCIIPSNGSS